MAVDKSDREPVKRKPRSPIVRVPKRIDVGPAYVNPSAEELDAIEAVLTDDTFASPRDMAKEVHKLAIHFTRNREWWTTYRGGHWFEGLESSEGRIRQWADKAYHPNQPRLVCQITGPGLLLERERAQREAFEKSEQERGGMCPECGHLAELHCTFLSGRVKPDQTNSVGPCSAPGGQAGPKTHPGVSKGHKFCGCRHYVRRKDEE